MDPTLIWPVSIFLILVIFGLQHNFNKVESRLKLKELEQHYKILELRAEIQELQDGLRKGDNN